MPRRPGRPMSADTTQRLLEATLSLLREEGLGGVTTDAVADRAGISKAAIYRRFADKPALVAAAIGAGLGDVSQPPDLGDVRAELRVLMQATRGERPATHVGLVGQLLAEHDRHPELIAAYREHVLSHRRAAFARVIERARRRGEVRGDVDLDLAVDLLSGLLLAATWRGAQADDRWLDDALELWARAVS